jgi:hypothetical protein
VEISNPRVVTFKNGRDAQSGQCPTCHKTIYRFLASSTRKEASVSIPEPPTAA